MTNIAFVDILDHRWGDSDHSVMLMVPNAEGWTRVLGRIVAFHREARRNGGGGPRQETPMLARW